MYKRNCGAVRIKLRFQIFYSILFNATVNKMCFSSCCNSLIIQAKKLTITEMMILLLCLFLFAERTCKRMIIKYFNGPNQHAAVNVGNNNRRSDIIVPYAR